MIADRFEQLEQAFHQRLRNGFLEIARSDPARVAIIDAADTRDRVHLAVVAAVSERLGVELMP
jgi:dTMP kinase